MGTGFHPQIPGMFSLSLRNVVSTLGCSPAEERVAQAAHYHFLGGE